MKDDAADKSYEPTQKKLDDARKKGEIARSVDLQTAAGYLGLTLALFSAGPGVIESFGSQLMVLLDRSVSLSDLMLEEDAFTAPFGGVLYSLARAVMPIFVVPAVLVLLAVLVQRAFVVTPSKLQPKLSRVSLLQNIKNKFGRAGLFEFFKSFVKLTIYATCMGFFLNAHMNDIVSVVRGEAIQALDLLGRLILQMMLVVIIVSMLIGALDAMFQQQEHIRKNMMSRKEMMDEQKESEGDPHLKQERRARAQSIATAQMMAEVPRSDVLIVNPTHYAVALCWDRAPGSAPVCVAKGVDALALRMREVAQESAVPIHSDPPTARVLHASVDIGQEVAPDHYEAVAAAIRFADQMRERAKGSV